MIFIPLTVVNSLSYGRFKGTLFWDGGATMRAVRKVPGLTLLRVGTLWRCGDGLFFEVPPLASDALLTMLHSLLENVNGVTR
jgi:hypothetical protein